MNELSFTFITIHDLSDEARILYSSDSIVDILGHTPDEVVNRSVWEWFHPDEVPLAKEKHRRGVKLDKAAVLAYARIKNRQGDYVGCECCFSVVYDVLVCCTSIYQHGSNSQRRAMEAPRVRRIFTSSPEDPRYHMLSHLSSKFSLGERQQTHEPRAALFLNRFTRSLTIMYATSGIAQVIGISAEAMKGRSFYYCIQEACLDDAVRVLESAKGNDSIAYLRFRFRDPRGDDGYTTPSDSEDEMMTDITSDDDESEDDSTDYSRRLSSHDSSSVSSNSRTSSTFSGAVDSPQLPPHEEIIELEAVVSCTSDGLVVCLRRARPMPPGAILNLAEPAHHGGIFAAPWAPEPVFQPALPQLPPYPLGAPHPVMRHAYPSPDFMQSIRDVAVFAWGLTGINGCLTDYAHGTPRGESQPADGFPIWDPPTHLEPKHSIASSGYGSGASCGGDPFGDPGLD